MGGHSLPSGQRVEKEPDMDRFAWAAALLLAVASAAFAQQDPMGGGRKSRPQKAPLPTPTEKDLGVPIYPGSKFDGDLSGGMSQSDQKIWVFFSNDPVAVVLAFYEQKTGRKGESFEKDKYMIKLAGASLVPEHGVSIETLEGNPLFGNRGKTSISVMRTVKP